MKPPPDLHYRYRFPAEIISQAVWLYHVFSLSFTMSNCSSLNEMLSPPMRRSGAGARSSARPLLAVYAAVGPGQETNGTSTKSSSGSIVQHYLWRAVDGVATRSVQNRTLSCQGWERNPNIAYRTERRDRGHSRCNRRSARCAPSQAARHAPGARRER